MNEIRLDGYEITTKEQFHSQIMERLSLPAYYGRNLDALWDVLTGEISLPLKLYWDHYTVSEEKLGKYAHQIVQLFREAEQEVDGFQFIAN